MHHFFIPPAQFNHPRICLTGEQAHQIRRVLRLRPGDMLTVLDGAGAAAEGRLISLDAREAQLEVVRRWPAAGEPATHITLYQAAPKGERFEWALQKATEIGVSAFVPLICQRSVVADLAAVEQKRARWERIIQEAAEQSGRGRLPRLGPAQPFATAMAAAAPAQPAIRLILWEGEREVGLTAALAGCNALARPRIEVFVGPEGGFTEDEILMARGHGCIPVSLGPRILRAETAGVVAAALILHDLGEI